MQAWENFLALQEAEIGPEAVSRWLRTLRIVKFDAGNLYLEARDPFHALWFEEHVRSKVLTQLVNNNGRRVRVHLSVRGKAATEQKEKRRSKPSDEVPPPFSLQFDDLDPSFTLQQFIPTEVNQLATNLIYEMTGFEKGTCRSDCIQLSAFNPVYLHGPSGVGKTHLLMAITAALRSVGVRAIYSRAETFTEHVVTAIRAGAMGTFRQAYRHADVLCIDDVQIFGKKKATQEEFFHTFNTLHTAGKQLVFAANGTPQELSHMEPRLISRFEWGIVVPLVQLKDDELGKLLDQRASSLRFSLTKAVREYLLETFQSSTGALMRSLDALVLRSHMGRDAAPVSELSAKELLKDLVDEESRSSITPDRIVKLVADAFSIPTEDLLGKSQQRDCVIPRQIAQHLCRDKLKMSYSQIGTFFNRDHSTVMAGIQKLKKMLSKGEADLSSIFHAIEKKL